MSNNEIVIQQQPNETTTMIAMIERLVLNPDVDIGKLEKMLDMQERILNRNAAQAYAADFALMQSELPRIARNGKIEIKDRSTGKITQSTPFAKLEDINDSVRPILQKYGFGVSFSISQENTLITVTAKLLHKLGHSDKTSISLPIDNSGSKNAVQGNGSTVSYGKRYALCALLNISTGDDTDGKLPEIEEVQKPQKQKTAITDDRLAGAVAKIKNGESSLDVLYRNFNLKDYQSKILMEQVPHDPMQFNQ